jgi:hypothetical protein
MLELSPGLMGTARLFTSHGEGSSEVYACGRREFFGPDGEEDAALADWEDWVRGWVARIASSPAPPGQPVSLWERLRRMFTRSAGSSAK